MPALGSVEEEEMSGFGLAPMKREGGKIEYDTDPGNPYEHPSEVRISSPALHAHARLTEKAQAYFMWELMNGTPKEELMKDEYWTYMEENANAT